jgi:hypothetical protein
MSSTVSTLLLRNLNDVFGEMDPERRRVAIDEIFHVDAVFYDPNGGTYRGRDAIDRIAGVIKAQHPDFRYQPLAPEVSGDGGRVRWVSGALASHPITAEQISSSPGTTRLLSTVSSSTRVHDRRLPMATLITP